MLWVFTRLVLPIVSVAYFIVFTVTDDLDDSLWGLWALLLLTFISNAVLETQYRAQFVGDIEIQDEDDRTTFSLVLQKYPEDWADKPQVIFRIKNSVESH